MSPSKCVIQTRPINTSSLPPPISTAEHNYSTPQVLQIISLEKSPNDVEKSVTPIENETLNTNKVCFSMNKSALPPFSKVNETECSPLPDSSDKLTNKKGKTARTARVSRAQSHLDTNSSDEIPLATIAKTTVKVFKFS